MKPRDGAKRFDISDWLIHFTFGDSSEQAFDRLQCIMAERRLIAGNKMIRGGYRCVCFTEAPLAAFRDDFVASHPFTRYSQFGVMFDKTWIHDRGGRQVIYQPDCEFDMLPESIRWRHVRYEPPSVDFTWEREWRICCDELQFSPREAIIVLPDEDWVTELIRDHDTDQDVLIEQYSQVLSNRQNAEMFRQSFDWRVVTLR